MQEGLGFENYQPLNKNYIGLCKYGKLMRLDFRKVFESGKLIGFYSVDISISPHYHFNQYRHNGNDFTPIQAIKTIIDILTYVGIEQREYEDLRVVNIEFGLNIIPQTDIKNLINGLYFYKKTPFKIGEFPYFRITDATSYKQIKAYAKGLQFSEFPQYGIHPNTFRFEVKSKQSKNIRKYGINTVADLLNLETYNRLGQTLLNEWENVLQINLTPDLKGLKFDEVQFTENAKTFGFWCEMIQPKYRNKFGRYKEKYYKILHEKNNLHAQIKGQIIDKLIYLSSGANSTHKTPTNREKDQNGNNTPILINLEFAPPQQNNRENNDEKKTSERSDKCNHCEVTKLPIFNQRKGSKFLSVVGLKYYKENYVNTFKKLEKKYLTVKQKGKDIELQLYYIAHNIRNEKTNPSHNPKYSRQRFEKRNYHKQQLQFNF